ncbi:hypothetical protein ACFOWT_08065 [Croceibacterium xixiisoli]
MVTPERKFVVEEIEGQFVVVDQSLTIRHNDSWTIASIAGSAKLHEIHDTRAAADRACHEANAGLTKE